MTLVPMILSNIKNFEPNASHRQFEQGRRVALKKEQELLDRLKLLTDGEQKVKKTTSRCRGGKCYDADQGWSKDQGEWNRKVFRISFTSKPMPIQRLIKSSSLFS